MGLRKRDFSATVGCESSEANPVEQGGIFVTVLKCPILRLRQEPPRPCRRNSHDSSADKVVGKMMFFGQRGEFFSIDEDLKFGFVGVFEVLMYGSLREGAVSEAD